jgi:hypothetical protein
MRTWLFYFILADFFVIFLSPATHAEYRVYRLGIKYDQKQKKEIEVLTTLDHIQYLTYYKITPTQETRLIEHWMCRGRTDEFKKYCTKPIASSPIVPNIQQAQGPSSQNTRAPAQQ